VTTATTDGPTNLSFEVGVLGAALWSPEGLLAVLDKARIDDFSAFPHRKLYETMLALSEEGVTPTVEVLEHRMRQDGSLEMLTDGTLSGSAYLDYLHENAAVSANVPHYIKNLRANASARGMILTGSQLINIGRAFSGNDPDQITEAVQVGTESMWRLSESTVPQTFLSIGDIVTEGYDEIVNGPEETTIIPTGFVDLDKQLHGGLKAGQVCVVAARPAVGKSVFGLNVAAYAAIKRGIPSVFYSLEMGRLELATRLLASEAKVPLDRLQEGNILQADDEKIKAHIEDIQDAPLYIDDTPGVDISMLANSIQFMVRRFGVQLVVLDYLQLVAGRKGEKSRQEEVSHVSRTLKLIAKREGIALIAIAQLNRNSESRSNGKPQISDLRESGSIEQDADLVVLLHREDQYDADSERKGEADFLVVKNRGGTTGTIPHAFLGHYSMFADMARDSGQPGGGY